MDKTLSAQQRPASSQESASPIWRALTFFMVPNLVMMGFAQWSSGSRPALFDVDYALVPVLHALLSRAGRPWMAAAGAIILTMFVVGADLFTTLTQIYFAAPAMLLDYLPFVSVWPWRWIGTILLAVGAAATLLVTVTLKRTTYIWDVVVMATALTVGLMIVDRLSAPWQRAPHALPNLVSSGVTEALRPSIGQAINEFHGEAARLDPSPTPTLASIIRNSRRPPRRILSVAVESWGRMRDKDHNAAMIAPLLERLSSQYEVEEDRLQPFYGATLAGEVRELCGLKQTGGIPQGADQYAQLRACLPAQLAREGYRTVAVHGNAGSFYRRTRFYPMMGFAEHWHYEQMRGQVVGLCSYLFVGICDGDAARIALAAFDGSRRAFVHLMTLDTHLPLPAPAGTCRAAAEPTLCTYSHGISSSLGAIAAAVVAAHSPPDLIVLYGDHAPPFVERRLRAQFIEGKVPFLVLRRRHGVS